MLRTRPADQASLVDESLVMVCMQIIVIVIILLHVVIILLLYYCILLLLHSFSLTSTVIDLLSSHISLLYFVEF